ncbi:MAG: hypothetical protein V3V62_01285, partial [bacterium]
VVAEAHRRKQTVVTVPRLEAVFDALIPGPAREMLRSRAKESLPSGPPGEGGGEGPMITWSLGAVEKLRGIEDGEERRGALEKIAAFAQERGLRRVTPSIFAAALGEPLRPPDRPGESEPR